MISYKGPTYLSADIPDIARDWRNNPTIWRWCRQNTFIDVNSHQTWLDNISKDKTIKMFGIRDEKTSYFVGVCGFTSINHINRTAEWSLYIAPLSQGKGYAYSALYNLLRHGFDDFNFNIIWGEIFADNSRCLHLSDKIGFKREGLLRDRYFKSGKYTDSIIVSIKKNELKEDLKINSFDSSDISYTDKPC
jgi:RimJ/RimL family protein N-acetyltransferase